MRRHGMTFDQVADAVRRSSWACRRCGQSGGNPAADDRAGLPQGGVRGPGPLDAKVKALSEGERPHSPWRWSRPRRRVRSTASPTPVTEASAKPRRIQNRTYLLDSSAFGRTLVEAAVEPVPEDRGRGAGQTPGLHRDRALVELWQELGAHEGNQQQRRQKDGRAPVARGCRSTASSNGRESATLPGATHAPGRAGGTPARRAPASALRPAPQKRRGRRSRSAPSAGTSSPRRTAT